MANSYSFFAEVIRMTMYNVVRKEVCQVLLGPYRMLTLSTENYYNASFFMLKLISRIFRVSLRGPLRSQTVELNAWI